MNILLTNDDDIHAPGLAALDDGLYLCHNPVRDLGSVIYIEINQYTKREEGILNYIMFQAVNCRVESTLPDYTNHIIQA